MALGHLALSDILSELVGERARASPDIAFSIAADGLDRSYGDSADLTIYRCIQESLTNALRHAQATRVDIEIRETRDAAAASKLELTVSDDGLGIDPAAPRGFGILGMQQRVQAMGGSYAVEGKRGRGTCVRITVPVRRADCGHSGVVA